MSGAEGAEGLLTPRWFHLRPHAPGEAFTASRARFNIVPAGRRSGKTERAKRRWARRAVAPPPPGQQVPTRIFIGAPTRDQVRRIYWEDMKALVPKWALGGEPAEGRLSIPLWHGGEIVLIGLDKPQRIEGSVWHGGLLDEFADLKPEVWPAHVRPVLSDTLGPCDIIGVPEGRNHFYELAEQARALMLEQPGEWAFHHWKSSEILSPAEIEAARRDLDELTFRQEYEASFVNFSGQAYYAFERDLNVAPVRHLYDPRAPLVFCFDFNVEPGVAVVLQERLLQHAGTLEERTCVLAEVHIPRNSNTPAVCRRLIQDWNPSDGRLGKHTGPVRIYGDATGGARGTARVEGSDWDLIRRDLGAVWRGLLQDRVGRHNPPERARVNAVNSRICSADGARRLVLDPSARELAKDLEGVRLLEGGSGEIDKAADPKLTHLSDALGYYVEAEHPTVKLPGTIRVTGY